MDEPRYGSGKRLWSAREDTVLRARYPHERTTAIATQLTRSIVAVYQRARILGLRKSATYLASVDACRLRRGDHVGAAWRYPKGHVPANKGTRRPGWSAGRMADTQFRRGQRSGKAAEHVMPIGSTRVIDGYLYRKVSEALNVPYTVNWKLEHHLRWIAAYGPLPPGHVLVFANGDPGDLRLENIQCITRRELMARNSVHTLPKPLAATVQLLGALNRQLRRRTSHAAEQN